MPDELPTEILDYEEDGLVVAATVVNGADVPQEDLDRMDEILLAEAAKRDPGATFRIENRVHNDPALRSMDYIRAVFLNAEENPQGDQAPAPQADIS
jgi:hypothetical protein